MSDQDFKDFLAAVEKSKRDVRTPEQAVEVLKREGVLDADGKVAAPYAAEGAK